MVERLRLQQEQVNRLTQELNSTRNQIRQMKAEQLGAKDRLDEAEKQQDKGVLAEEAVRRVRSGLEELKRQEQVLSERELQVAGQLEIEQTSLADLNKRLDSLEREMMVTGANDDSKGPVKR
jgi:phage shock protein A